MDSVGVSISACVSAEVSVKLSLNPLTRFTRVNGFNDSGDSG